LLSDLPEPVARIAALMSTFDAPWALCGGWAVDLWLDHETRQHGDLDVTVFQHDQRAIFQHLAGWTLVAHDPDVDQDTREPWDGRTLAMPAHVHARHDDGFDLELIFNRRLAGDWLLNAEPAMTFPVERAIRPFGGGLPLAAPEVLLFYKSRICRGCPGCSAPSRLRRRDEADFRALAPTLPLAGRHWLQEAIALVEPDHPWLPLLDG
jgi:hypothetical protein